MATRGTYQIGNLNLYNHWDNYPEGAAVHLIGVIRKYGNLEPFSVVRGMENASPATSIYDGPAEFHYKIKGEKIECYSVSDESSQIFLRSSGTIEEWLNTNVKRALDDDDDKEDYTVVKDRYRYYTKRSAFNQALTKLEESKKYPENSGNQSYAIREAFDLFKLSGLVEDFKKIDFSEYSQEAKIQAAQFKASAQ